MIFKTWRYLTREKKVPRLSTALKTAYDPLSLSEDEMIVIMSGYAKDRIGVAMLFEEHGVSTAAELLPKLPKPSKPSFRDRLISFARRLEGSTGYDPLKRELNTMKPVKAKPGIGYGYVKPRKHH
jgi:hypothetical protein